MLEPQIQILRVQYKRHALWGIAWHENGQAIFKGSQGLDLRSTFRYG
jgi:hypothetical protein